MFVKQFLTLGLFSLCVACSAPQSQQGSEIQTANAEKLEASWYLNPAQSGVNYTTIKAGATAVQLYTAMVYHGVSLAGDIARGLEHLLESDGFGSIAEAVGTARGDWL